jgi:hypothetical protein
MFRYPRFWTVAGIVLLALIAAWDAPAPFRLSAAAGSPGSVNLSAQAACPAVSGTPYLTIVYGSVQLDGTGAPVGTIVEAVSPRDDVVGCFVVHTAGYYGTMYVYGEDSAANPPIPGMRDGETVTFRVDGLVATASPLLVWHNDWTPHQIALSASSGVPLQIGWNLIALPRIPSDPAPAAVLAPIAGQYTQVYAYDACDVADPWKIYDPAAPPYANDLTSMDVQHGYWIRATGTVTLTVAGTRPTSTTIPLCTGGTSPSGDWNLIGYPSAAAVALPDALAGIAGKYNLVYAYDAADTADPWKKFDPNAPPFVNDLTELGAGKGYWIRVTEATTLIIN